MTRRLRAAVLACGLVAAVLPAAPAAALLPVPHARVADVETLGRTALAGVARHQRPDGLFPDPIGRLVGGTGLPTLAWAALHQIHHDAEGAEWRRLVARRTLARGSGASVIQNWPLAMIVAMDLDAVLPAERDGLRSRVLGWSTLKAAGVADRCFRLATCFNNYRLADLVLNLELARSGLSSTVPGARLADPAGLRRRTLEWLRIALPGVAPATATIEIPGLGTRRGTILSDPHTYPLAYATLSTAWAVRATVLAGADASPEQRSVTRDALWGLLGVTAPDGQVAWSGRGQDQVWSLAALFYAASAGSRLYADTDPELAARLRRLADIELVALQGRMHDGELQVGPSGNTMIAGLDHYYSIVGSTAIALVWIELARDELADPAARRLRIPSEIDGAVFADSARTGLLTRRVGRTWLALRMHRDHPSDPRQGFGMSRALRLDPGGWRELRPERPRTLSRVSRPPATGPVLLRHGNVVRPKAVLWARAPRGLQLYGAWGAGTLARWRYTAVDGGVVFRSTCPRGTHLRFTEWLPSAGRLVVSPHRLRRGAWRVVLSRPVKVQVLRTGYANARQGPVRAVQATVACRTPSVTVRWTGGARVLP